MKNTPRTPRKRITTSATKVFSSSNLSLHRCKSLDTIPTPFNPEGPGYTGPAIHKGIFKAL